MLEQLLHHNDSFARDEGDNNEQHDIFEKKKAEADKQNSFFAGVGDEIYDYHLGVDLEDPEKNNINGREDYITAETDHNSKRDDNKKNASVLLDEPLSMTELVTVLVHTDQNSAPGIDGMGNVFIRAACGVGSRREMENDSDNDELLDNNDTEIANEYDDFAPPPDNNDGMTTLQHMMKRAKKW